MKLNFNQANLTKILLTLVFLLSYSQYFFEMNLQILLIPISVLLLIGYVTIIFSPKDVIKKIFAKTLASSNSFFVIALPLISTISSLFSQTWDPALYGLLMIATLTTIRSILCVVSLEDILLSYFYAAVIFLVIFLSISTSNLIEAILMNQRFANLNFHPNLLAFLLVGSIPVYLWVYKIKTKHNWWILILILINVTIVFYASSRGSIASLLAGIAGISLLSYIKSIPNKSQQNKRQSFFKAALFFILVAVLIIVSPSMIHVTDSFTSYVSEILQLNNPYRGLYSGLSGRIDRWDFALKDLEHGSLLLGNGYRTGSAKLGFSIDNGYLTLVYETGIIVTIFIVLKYLWVTVSFIREYLSSKTVRNSAFFLTIIFIMVIFLTNNIVARYLFGLGNPFSLLCLFFLVISRKDIDIINLRAGGKNRKVSSTFITSVYSPKSSQVNLRQR